MHALKHIAIGLIATGLLLAATTLFGKTQWGHALEVQAYKFLQSALPSFSGGPLPVVVVDISKLPGGKDLATPRAQLRELVDAIAKVSPRAIALDIDFSPTESGWMTPADPEFFDFCLATQRQRGTPIFLGVYRTRAEGPQAWLGLPKYQGLAAGGLVRGEDTRRIPRWVRSGDSRAVLPTLGEALANAYRARQPTAPSWIAWALERRENWNTMKERSSEVHAADVLVNYSKLEQLKTEHMSFSRASTVEEVGERLRGRLVLLGDVRSSTDKFIVPGQSVPVPGVYLMASAAYTLAVAPMFEFTHLIRLGLDLTISLIIVLGVLYIKRHTPKIKDTPKRTSRFLWATIAAVLISGLVLVRCIGIMWLDFLLVPFALLLHPKVEEWLSKRFELLRKGSNGA